MGLWGSIKSGAKAVGGAAKAVGGAVKDGVEKVADEVEDLGDKVGGWIADQACSTGFGPACALGAFLGGVISGFGKVVSGTLRTTASIVDRGFGALGNVLQGRFGAALEDLVAVGALIVVGVVELGTGVLRPFDEYERHWERNALKRFVSDRIDALWRDDEEMRTALRSSIGVDRRTGWGLAVPSRHRRLSFDSADVDLRRSHNDTWQGDRVIDLHAAASSRGGPKHQGKATLFLVAEEGRLLGGASDEDVDAYLRGEDTRLRLVAMQSQHARQSMRYARKVCTDIGIKLSWETSPKATWDAVLPADASGPLYVPLVWKSGPEQGAMLRHFGFRDGTFATECELEAFATLNTFETARPGEWRDGVASGQNRREGDAASDCRTPVDRTDRCCASLSVLTLQSDTGRKKIVEGTSVAHTWPNGQWGDRVVSDIRNRFILAHEIGHWLGLCHEGHRKMTQIMYSAARYGAVGGALAFGAVSRGYQHPRFVRADGQNAWKYLLDQHVGRCLGHDPQPDPNREEQFE